MTSREILSEPIFWFFVLYFVILAVYDILSVINKKSEEAGKLSACTCTKNEKCAICRSMQEFHDYLRYY